MLAEDVLLYLAASILWHYKPPLQSYNDENDSVATPKMPKMPRKLKYRTTEQHHQCFLPVYINKIQKQHIYYGRDSILQEDNDPLHTTRLRDIVARKLRHRAGLTLLYTQPNRQILIQSRASRISLSNEFVVVVMIGRLWRSLIRK